MGTRINKAIGYGLADLTVQDGKVVDERINPNGLMVLIDDYRWTLNGYLSWLKNKPKDFNIEVETRFIEQLKTENPTFLVSDCIVHDSEHEPSIALFVSPCSVNSWIRHDDVIDYYENEVNENFNLKPRLHIFDHNLYPWSGTYWDIRDGRIIDPTYACMYKRMLQSGVDQDVLTNFAELCGMSVEECDQFLRPMVPESLQLFLEYCEVFKDVATIRQLQPMFYCFWC